MSEQSEFYNKEFDNGLCKLVQQRDTFKQTLDEIERYCNKNIKIRLKGYQMEYTTKSRIYLPILNIINKAKKTVLNVETVGKPCNSGRYYFNCSECDNQSIVDYGKTCYSCLNYQNIFDDTESKFYCGNYFKAKDGE